MSEAPKSKDIRTTLSRITARAGLLTAGLIAWLVYLHASTKPSVPDDVACRTEGKTYYFIEFDKTNRAIYQCK